MPRTIRIAVPCYSGEVVGHAMLSILRAVEEGREQGWRVDVSIRPLDSLLARARNVMLTEFLASGADDLLWWDADLAAAPGAFTRLMSHRVDCVAGAYPARSDPERYALNLAAASAPDPATGLRRIEGVGAGFLRVTRAAVERTAAHFPGLWCNDRQAGRLVWLFDGLLIDHEYWGEDMIFCRRCIEAGVEAWLDPELTFHHFGMKAFSGCFGAYERRRAAAAITPAELAEERTLLDAALI